MKQQTIGWDQWLVVNDGTEEYQYTMGQEVIKRDPSKDTLPSICENWLVALEHVKGDRVIVVEDDDYYDPAHVETLAGYLKACDLVGFSHDVYWKFPTRRFVRMHNDAHASLAATGFRRKLFKQVERCCKKVKTIFIDMYLWCEAPVKSKRLIKQPLPNGRMSHVGMKNMPGCPGLGIGHENMHQGSTDYTFATLAEWAGHEASQVYRRLWTDRYVNTP